MITLYGKHLMKNTLGQFMRRVSMNLDIGAHFLEEKF